MNKIIINEVYPAPSEGSEWIELFNPTAETIVLENWTVFDQLSSPTCIFTFTTQEIKPNKFLVIELPSAKLNNSADGVTLKNSLGEIINEMQFSSSEAGMSWSRNQTGEFELTQPSKGAVNIFPSPSPSPSPQPSSSPSPSPTPSPSSPSTSPSPSPSASPETNQTTNEQTNSNQTQSPSTSPQPNPSPPTKPSLHYSLQQIYLGSNSATIQLPPPTQIFTHHEPPLLAILGVILGGLLLFLANSWIIYEKFWKNKNNS
ncbi:lamin tail domain-containing protein [Patescibacteria group bacterium]|nr:lamin tail domain-containing protein [Patescibacteria group bacterium]MBU1884987.1 lamin tail domain-containing protein [Patescibacteria group bacterium]